MSYRRGRKEWLYPTEPTGLSIPSVIVSVEHKSTFEESEGLYEDSYKLYQVKSISHIDYIKGQMKAYDSVRNREVSSIESASNSFDFKSLGVTHVFPVTEHLFFVVFTSIMELHYLDLIFLYVCMINICKRILQKHVCIP